MDWITKIDWATIIEKSASSPLGIVALGLIALSLLVWGLFRKSGGLVKLGSVITVIAGVSVFSLVVNVEISIERDTIKEKERFETLLSDCKSEGKSVSGHCRASDRSGFHSSPYARCDITLAAPKGYFFSENQVEVISEHYRNLSGASAKNSTKSATSVINGEAFVTSFSGTIGCTNVQGNGSTCVAEANVKQMAYPIKCTEVYKELRI